MCAVVQNNAQVFSAPNTLVPASLTAFSQQDCSASASSPLVPGSNKFNCLGYVMADDTMYGVFTAPAPMPKSETITFAAVNNDPGEQNENGADGATCANSQYLLCSVTAADSADPMNVSYLVTNLPITVQVTNNLSASNNDTLTMQGQPQASQMLIDPAGGNPTTIAPGTSGYFGLYGSTGSVNADPESFYVQYRIGSDSNDLAGSRFLINVIIDQATGTLVKSGSSTSSASPSATDNGNSGCTFLPGATSQSGNTYCDLSLEGAAGGPQTVIVDIHQ